MYGFRSHSGSNFEALRSERGALRMMLLLRCTRCDQVGHAAAFCPFFRQERDGHADAQLGDNVPHINQVQITISANSVVMEESQREVGWWENQPLSVVDRRLESLHFKGGS